MRPHLEFIGILLIGLALLHVIFPRYFRWREELAGVGLVTRQILYVHTFFIALTVFLMGLLCFAGSDELISTDFGRKIALGLFAFWFSRLIIQFFGYSSLLWRGKTFETFVHIAFTLFWAYLSVIFLLIGIGR